MERHASPQAWRRLRKTMSEGELRDIAQDIVQEVTLGAQDISLTQAIEAALILTPWENYKQK